MKLKFEGIHLSNIGRKAGVTDKQWAKLSIYLKDGDTNHSMTVDVDLLVSKSPTATMLQLQQEARDSAISVLREALSLIESDSLDGLERREAEQEAGVQEEIDAALDFSKP